METSYKEKYEQALERCRKLYNEAKANEYTSDIEDYETIFPELKENERIRKELIKHLKELSDWKEDEVIPVKNPSYYQQWASWLEKQELKSNPYSGVSFNYNGSTWGMCARDNGVDISCDKHLIKHLEKQGEQKIEENKGNIEGISPNSAWSEEDEHRLNSCLNILQPKTFVGNTETINTKWLKSLKNRVQPKQEWSEEDERNLQGVIDEIEANKNQAPDCDLATYDRFLSWLKSLKGRVQPKVELTQFDKNILEAAIAFVKQNNQFQLLGWR